MVTRLVGEHKTPTNSQAGHPRDYPRPFIFNPLYTVGDGHHKEVVFALCSMNLNLHTVGQVGPLTPTNYKASSHETGSSFLHISASVHR